MKHWPVPKSSSKSLPNNGERGSFWENRSDRRHAGVDMYAPIDSDVLAIEDGTVLKVAEFTSPELIPYWNITYSIIIQTDDGTIQRYAELRDSVVKAGDRVKGGQVIGHIGHVLDLDKINETSPGYIQKLKNAGVSSMLHFELHNRFPGKPDKYLGGNFFQEEQPDHLVNPTDYLREVIEETSESEK